jgi:hypothetical protein
MNLFVILVVGFSWLELNVQDWAALNIGSFQIFR